MMACKKALVEAQGNEELAIEILRKSGEAKAAAKSDRETKEGCVSVVIAGNKAVIASLNCETDFVARNDQFVALTEKVARLYLEKGDAAQAEVDTILKENIITLGENITLGKMEVLEGEVLGFYVHSNRKVAAVAALSGGTEDQARDVAMHITAQNPTVLSPEEVDGTSIAKESEIYKEQLRNEGKPEAMLDKIIEGKVKKFKEEQALLTQSFIKDPSQTITAMLGSAKVSGFKRIEV